MSFAETQVGANEKYGVMLPEYGAPRSLSLDTLRMDVAMAQLDRRVTDTPTPGMMSGRPGGGASALLRGGLS